ncbi:active regulator of SIRT1 [Arapaima gigas]
MSVSLVRRGLDLLSDDVKSFTEDKNRKRKKAKSKSTAEENKEKRIMDQISSNKQGVTRQIRRLRGQHCSAKPRATIKDKKMKSAVDEFRKRQKSYLKQNLRYFVGKKINGSQSDTAKIQAQNRGRQSRNKPNTVSKKPKKPKSVFTEEEFEQFQKEYFGRTVEEDGQ